MLIGNIPDCMGNLYLTKMILSSNKLSGVIPSSFCLRSGLTQLQLNDNNLSGEVPQALGNLVKLNLLDLGENKISGNIPEWINNLTRLSVLRLHKNNFNGRFPRSLCKLSDLRILDLAHNSLSGSIPRCFGELHGMRKLPSSYTNLKKFNYNGNVMQPGLNLPHNHLNGVIPKGIGNMTSLFSLDFSSNGLIGTIPPCIATLNSLSHLNVSHNNLSGSIPTGAQLQTLTDPSIYAGNRDLCGALLPKNCSNNEDTPTTTSKNIYENGNEPKKVWSYLTTVCSFATSFWGFIGVSLFKKQWRHRLFMFTEATMDKIYVAVVVRVSKMKRGREAA
nr:putative leucine-rich repeat protein, plant-type [Tanacetum cinerariifolium]